ncbi:MAG: uroporphyrinogen-III C-methyltransferase [Actinomycetes bacterium]
MPDRLGLAPGVRLNGRRVVVVGGGARALAAAAAALDADAQVLVVAPRCTSGLVGLAAAGRVVWRERAYQEEDLADAWLVVAATEHPALDAAVLADAQLRGVPSAVASPGWSVDTGVARAGPGVGRVVLVGAGPGDPGLVTVRGRQELDAADVVIVDHLAPLGLLVELRPGVEVIDAAKVPRGPGLAQREINELLVDRARRGLRVVRLKGGDPFVFGRGMEEVQACQDAGIPVEVVPGVSSAIAVPGLAGIPVTHRGMVQAFCVVSGHIAPDDPSSTIDWAALAASGATLVVLMGVATMSAIAERLIAAGLGGSTPVACVQRGASPAQAVHRSTLEQIGTDISRTGIRPPAVFVIGQVVDAATLRDTSPPPTSPPPTSPEAPCAPNVRPTRSSSATSPSTTSVAH